MMQNTPDSFHSHVQTMILSIDVPSSIRLKENRTGAGHGAVHQQLNSISPSPAHGGGAVSTFGERVERPDMDSRCNQVRVQRHVRRPRCARGDPRDRDDDPD